MVVMFAVLVSFVACGSGGTGSEEAAKVTTAENGSVTLDGDKVAEILGTDTDTDTDTGTDTDTDTGTVNGTTLPAGSEVAEGGVLPGDQATVETGGADQQDDSDTAAKEDLQDNLFLYTDIDGDGILDDEETVVDAVIVYNGITDTYTVTPANGFDSDKAYLVVGVDPDTGEKTVLVIISVSAGKDTTAPVLLSSNIQNGATGVEVGLPLV